MGKPRVSKTSSEDAADVRAYDEAMAKLASGEDELIPLAMVSRMLTGESAVRVWREHRGLTAEDLAERAEISVAEVAEIENGGREGGVETLRSIARALGVQLDDLA